MLHVETIDCFTTREAGRSRQGEKISCERDLRSFSERVFCFERWSQSIPLAGTDLASLNIAPPCHTLFSLFIDPILFIYTVLLMSNDPVHSCLHRPA